MSCLDQRPQHVSRTRACEALGLSRTGTYTRAPRPRRRQSQPVPPRELSEAEQAEILAVVNSEVYEDASVRVIHARELDHGRMLASVSSIYRVLRRQAQTTERRNQRPPQNHAVPRLVADAPNVAWSWDIVRREAPLNRVEVRDLHPPSVAAEGEKLRAARTRRCGREREQP